MADGAEYNELLVHASQSTVDIEDLTDRLRRMSLSETKHGEGGKNTTTGDSYQRDESLHDEEPALQRVLAIPELFELILLKLPIRQLLIKMPLVSKHWKATIDTSPRLQQALFFQPIPYEPLQLLTIKEKPTVKAWMRDLSDPYEYTVLMNPFAYINIKGRDEALERLQASWRRMIVSQPPVKSAKDVLTENYGCSHGLSDTSHDVQFGDRMLSAETRTEGVGMWKKVYFAHQVGLLRKPRTWKT